METLKEGLAKAFEQRLEIEKLRGLAGGLRGAAAACGRLSSRCAAEDAGLAGVALAGLAARLYDCAAEIDGEVGHVLDKALDAGGALELGPLPGASAELLQRFEDEVSRFRRIGNALGARQAADLLDEGATDDPRLQPLRDLAAGFRETAKKEL